MLLMGTENRKSAYNLHRTIREALTPPALLAGGRCKANLTILEYCIFTGDDYRHVYFTLRGEYPDYDPPTRHSS